MASLKCRLLLVSVIAVCAADTCVFSQPKETPSKADLFVYGGTAGGVIAATQAARLGAQVILLEPGQHIGGMTSGGLGATDFKNADAVGGMAREFYQRVKAYYANPEAWTWERPEEYQSHRHDPRSDVMFHFEPHVAEEILRQMLAEAGVRVECGQRLDLLHGIDKENQRLTSLKMESGQVFAARMFIDATYEGDVMAEAGVSYHVGREGNSIYQETMNGVQTLRVPYNGHNFFRPISPYVIPDKPDSGLLFGVQADPPGAEGQGDTRVQAYCFRLCLTNVPENRIPFPQPVGYDPSRYDLLLRYLHSQDQGQTFPDHPEPREIESPALGRDPFIVIMPNHKTDMNSKGAISSNLVGMNYEYPDGDYATRAHIVAAHKEWHQGMLWFMQHDERVPVSFRAPLQEWGLARDEFQDTEHWPHQLYIREARRMIGDFVMTEHHCLGTQPVADSVGLACYTMDSHVTQRYVDQQGWVRNEGNIGGRVPAPYGVSYRCLTPQRDECQNLLVPVCCSASHVAYGSIRMEPVFMALGQAAGLAAILANQHDAAVQDVDYPTLREQLIARGGRLDWPLQPLQPTATSD